MNLSGYMSSSDWNKNWSLNQSVIFNKLLGYTQDYYHQVIEKMFIHHKIEGKTILELGCGSAEDTFWFMNKFKYKKAAVVDFSEKALEKVKANKGDLNISLINQDILNLRLKGKFDLVHSGFVVEHFYGKDRERVIKKHSEFVNDGGFVFIQAPGKTFFSILYSKTINKINGIDEELYTKKEILGLIKKANLEVTDMKILFNGAVFFLLLQNNK